MTSRHVSARGVRHLVLPQDRLPVFTSTVIQSCPIGPVGSRVDINDATTIGIVGIFWSRLNNPTFPFGELQVRRCKRCSCPALLFIARDNPFFWRPSDTRDLTSRDLAL